MWGGDQQPVAPPAAGPPLLGASGGRRRDDIRARLPPRVRGHRAAGALACSPTRSWSKSYLYTLASALDVVTGWPFCKTMRADIAMVHPVKAAPYFAHAQFSTPETILALPDTGDEIPYVKAMWHYARGVALAAQGKFVEAGLEATAIEAIT